jgi:hypothetical protein
VLSQRRWSLWPLARVLAQGILAWTPSEELVLVAMNEHATQHRGKLTPQIRQAWEQKLSHPNGWRSYGELKAWLQREFGISSSYSSVYRWVS